MTRYYKVSRNLSAKEMAKSNISKRTKKSGGFFSTLKFLFIMACACALAGVASLFVVTSSD